MLRAQRECVRTEASIDEKENKTIDYGEWMLSSHQKKKKISCTPLRFAGMKIKNKGEEKEDPSTRQKSAKERPSLCMKVKPEIANALHVLKELSKECNKEQIEIDHKITPFTLTSDDIFQSQISFKGVSNRLILLHSIDKIQSEREQLMNSVQSMKYRNALDSKTYDGTNKIKLTASSQKRSFLEIGSYLHKTFKDLQELGVELSRCLKIIKSSPGISQKSLNFYKDRFQSVIGGLNENIGCLQRYIDVTRQLSFQRNQHRKQKVSKFNGQ